LSKPHKRVFLSSSKRKWQNALEAAQQRELMETLECSFHPTLITGRSEERITRRSIQEFYDDQCKYEHRKKQNISTFDITQQQELKENICSQSKERKRR
jgi:hypothetical protein